MKKQILILVMALVAISFQQVIAQVPYLEPTELDCIDLEDPLNVVPGHDYTYTVTVPNPGPHLYHWFVTQDTEFIEEGALVATPETIPASAILASGSGHYNTPTTGANSITLTWNSFILNPGQYVFVGIFVVDENGCSNNLKVYRIRPLHAFTLDLANVNNNVVPPILAPDGFDQCVSEIESAVFDVDHGDDGGIVYNFGRDSLYYVVAAANFSTGYQLQYIFSGLQGATPEGSLPQTASIAWSYTMAGLETATAQSITDGAIGTLGIVQAQDAPVGADGEMVYIKVLILHNHYELTTDTPYSFAIDGVLTDATGIVLDPDLYADLHHGDCDFDGFDNDVTTQVLNARPTINAVSPDLLPIAP
jgi:hypothetical protein